MTKFIVALSAAFLLFAPPAEAKHHHRYHHHTRIALGDSQGCVLDNSGHRTCRGRVSTDIGHARVKVFSEGWNVRVAGYRPPGCPHAWCGCGTSLRVFGRIIPELNLASNWRRFPSASPASGMVAWRSGHVFYIEAVNGDGTVVAYDPNSGGHVAHIHTRSLRGFHVVNPHGSRMAGL